MRVYIRKKSREWPDLWIELSPSEKMQDNAFVLLRSLFCQHRILYDWIGYHNESDWISWDPNGDSFNPQMSRGFGMFWRELCSRDACGILDVAGRFLLDVYPQFSTWRVNKLKTAPDCEYYFVLSLYNEEEAKKNDRG